MTLKGRINYVKCLPNVFDWSKILAENVRFADRRKIRGTRHNNINTNVNKSSSQL